MAKIAESTARPASNGRQHKVIKASGLRVKRIFRGVAGASTTMESIHTEDAAAQPLRNIVHGAAPEPRHRGVMAAPDDQQVDSIYGDVIDDGLHLIALHNYGLGLDAGGGGFCYAFLLQFAIEGVAVIQQCLAG